MKLKNIDSVENLLKDAENESVNSSDIWWVYAASPDIIILDYWNPNNGIPEGMKSRLLELRIFSEKAEYKAFRGDIGHDLQCRKITDDGSESEEEYFDEIQYLDINLKNATKNNKNEQPLWKAMTTTGGGPYNVPLEDVADACAVVRNYLSYSEDNGQAYISDFRLVKLDNIKVQD